jgi:flagellin-like protein
MKGISPLIAAVLLIAFTITIAILIVSWGSSFVTQTTSGIGNKSTELIDCSGAAIEIDSVYVASNATTIIIRNVGIKAVSVTSVAVMNTTGGIATVSTGNNITTVTGMARGAIGSVTVGDGRLGSSCAAFSKVTVASACPGIAAEWTKSPTSCT